MSMVSARRALNEMTGCLGRLPGAFLLGAATLLAACGDVTGPDGAHLPDVRDESVPELEAVDFALLGSNTIAFERLSLTALPGSGLPGIYVVDGGALRVRSHLGGTVSSGAAVSPDGSEVAFTLLTPIDPSLPRSEYTFWDLYVARLDGSNLRRLAAWPNNVEGPPSWSPAGDKVYFGQLSGLSDVNIYEQSPIDGPGDRRLVTTLRATSWDREHFRVAASPSGSLAFTVPWEGGNATKGVHIVEPGDTMPVGIYEPSLDEEVRVRAPAWSPDGTRLAFLETVDGTPGSPTSETRVKVIRMDDSSVTDIGALVVDGFNLGGLAGANTFSACWTQDASRIVFSASDGPSTGHIYVVSATGGTPTALTSSPGTTDRSLSCLR